MSKHSFSWKNWHTGLNNDDMTLREVYETLPGHDSTDISFHVKLFENPTSPFAFKGAIGLEDHDCVHILLGRGLFNQDEAFVIGFTMGTNDLPNWQYKIFQWITQYFYKKPYKFNDSAIMAYKLGVAYGQEVRKSGKCQDIQDKGLFSQKYLDRKIGDIRKEFGIDPQKLRSIFRTEQIKVYGTKASLRLPVDKNITMTRLSTIKEAKDCDWYDD